MNPYLKGLHLTLDNCIPHINEEGCKFQGSLLKIVELVGEWEILEEVNNLILLNGVPFMGYDILALRKLTEVEKLHRR